MERLGIALGAGLSPADTVECARVAEEIGYESAWLIEGHGGDQFSLATACALATRRIRLGTAISSVFVRTAPTIAMAAACLDHFSQGRFILGLGSSHKVQVEPEHGVRYGEPVTRVRETVEIVRALLRDGSVSFHGRTVVIERFDLWFKPLHKSVPIYLSALFPKMLELCGEVAQGLLMVFSTRDSARSAIAHLTAGAARAGRGVNEIEIATLLPTSVDRDRKTAYDRVRPVLSFYVGFFPRYRRLVSEAGFSEAADAAAKAYARGDREGSLAAIPDEMVAALTVSGTASEARARIAEYRRSGIALPILMPVANAETELAEVVATLRACTE